jgi:hypothetical protein
MPEINADIRVKNAEFELNLTVATFCLNPAWIVIWQHGFDTKYAKEHCHEGWVETNQSNIHKHPYLTSVSMPSA